MVLLRRANEPAVTVSRPGDDEGPLEREWKWVVPGKAALAGLERVDPPDGLIAGAWRLRVLDNAYYDTADGALRAVHAALRVRRDGGAGLLLTLKEGHRREGALHRVTEWETRLDRFSPREPWRSAVRPVRRLLELVGRQPLEQWVHFSTERRERPILRQGREVATQVLDCTTWSGGGEFLEMELELRAGEDASEEWVIWMAELARRFALVPSEMTKLARAAARIGAG